jgi:putative acetyltransferase
VNVIVSRSYDRRMQVRRYDRADAAGTLAVFLDAVRTTASRHYTPRQVEAWTSAGRDIVEWDRARASANTRVAEVDGRVVGFTDVSANGFIGMLFVASNHGRRGVATALLSWAESAARSQGSARLSTHASITARSFFEARGFDVVEERTPIVDGIAMTNYLMVRPLEERR